MYMTDSSPSHTQTTSKEFLKFNTSLATSSNHAGVGKDENGNVEAAIELQLPSSILPVRDPSINQIDFEVTKMLASQLNLPVASLPLKRHTWFHGGFRDLGTGLYLQLYPYSLWEDGTLFPREQASVQAVWGDSGVDNCIPDWNHVIKELVPARGFSKIDYDDSLKSDKLLVSSLDAVSEMWERCLNELLFEARRKPRYPAVGFTEGYAYPPQTQVSLTTDSFSITLQTAIQRNFNLAVLWGTKGAIDYSKTMAPIGPEGGEGWTPKCYRTYYRRKPDVNSTSAEDVCFTYMLPMSFNIIANRETRDVFNFLPWIKIEKKNCADHQVPNICNPEYEYFTDYPEEFYMLDCSNAHIDVSNPVDLMEKNNKESGIGFIQGGYDITHTWKNVATILLSPITSLVLTLTGMQTNEQILPVNMRQPGGLSIVTSVPVIENFYPLTSSLRDLHDNLVISRDSFTNNAVMYVKGQLDGFSDRTLVFRLFYLMKDGELRKVMIPPNGVFSLQVTFCIYR